MKRIAMRPTRQAPMPSKPRTDEDNTRSAHAPSLNARRSQAWDDQRWLRASQIALIGLFVIALLWCAYAAQHVVVPVLLGWTIATIVLPIVKWMESRGVQRFLAALAITGLLLLLIAILFLLLSAPLSYWLGRATYIGALLREKFES